MDSAHGKNKAMVVDGKGGVKSLDGKPFDSYEERLKGGRRTLTFL